MEFAPTPPPPRSQPPGFEIAMADILSTMTKMQQKMDGMEKELLEVRQKSADAKWKSDVDKKWKSDVSEGDEQEQEQEQAQE